MIKSSRRKHLENASRVIHLQCLSEQEPDSLNIYNIKNDKWDGIKLKVFLYNKRNNKQSAVSVYRLWRDVYLKWLKYRTYKEL